MQQICGMIKKMSLKKSCQYSSKASHTKMKTQNESQLQQPCSGENENASSTDTVIKAEDTMGSPLPALPLGYTLLPAFLIASYHPASEDQAELVPIPVITAPKCPLSLLPYFLILTSIDYSVQET